MKIVKILTLFLTLTTLGLTAQDISNNALGLRMGDSDGFGAEISYQKSIGRTTRVEFDLGWRDSRAYDAFKLAAVYQWVAIIDGDFNWYYGVGGGLGNVDFVLPIQEDGLFVFAAGNIGVEYNFSIPLLISLDFRPEIGLVGYNDFENNFDFDIALGVRYQF